MRNQALQEVVGSKDSLCTLPNVSVRVSARAKHTLLKVLHNGQIELVVPRRHNAARVREFMQDNRVWLAKTLAKHEQLKRDHPGRFSDRPERVDLIALNRSWHVAYDAGASNSAKPSLRCNNNEQLLLVTQSQADTRRLLQRWLSEMAKQHLIAWARNVSKECELPINKVSIRAQKTRWASCSADKNIGLNRCVLFLPPNLVHYLLIHELCHTVHLNHSKRFWQLVERFAPDYRVLEKELNFHSRHIPLWAI